MNYIYIVIKTEDLPKVDLSKTCITSEDTLRFTQDGSFTFIDWIGETPDFVRHLDFEGPYNNDEMLHILQQPNWELPESNFE